MNYGFRLQYHLQATSPVSRPLSPETYRKTHTLSAKGALQPFPYLLMDFQLPFEAVGDATEKLLVLEKNTRTDAFSSKRKKDCVNVVKVGILLEPIGSKVCGGLENSFRSNKKKKKLETSMGTE
ncbi:hypothetical protein TNCV_2965351 [Trichonephila clavipes]|nr:hypothetical protein TNCV_2965351 [Trichonephila clavipes]